MCNKSTVLCAISAMSDNCITSRSSQTVLGEAFMLRCCQYGYTTVSTILSIWIQLAQFFPFMKKNPHQHQHHCNIIIHIIGTSIIYFIIINIIIYKLYRMYIIDIYMHKCSKSLHTGINAQYLTQWRKDLLSELTKNL